jgi:hypothetical protein
MVQRAGEHAPVAGVASGANIEARTALIIRLGQTLFALPTFSTPHLFAVLVIIADRFDGVGAFDILVDLLIGQPGGATPLEGFADLLIAIDQRQPRRLRRLCDRPR